MGCLTTEKLVASWDGLLPPSELEELEAHLAACKACQRLEQSMQRLRELLPHAFSGPTLGAGDACATEAQLVGYLNGSLEEEDSERLRSHLAGCRHCVGQFASIVAANEQPLPSLDGEWRAATAKALALVDKSGAPDSKPATRRHSWNWALSAAAMLMMVVSGWYAYRQVRPPDEGISGQPEIRLRQAPLQPAATPVLLVPREGQHLSRSKLEFQWQPVVGAEAYAVTLLDRRGDVIWEQATPETSLRPPESVSLEPGQRYFVWLRVRLEGGQATRSSAVAFTLSAEAAP